MIHGVPKSFDVSKPANLARLASENNFQASDLVRVRWLGTWDAFSAKSAGSLVLSFTNKDLAVRIARSGVFLNYDYHRAAKFKPRPPQCFKCLRMGHFGKWCRDRTRCAKCGDKHTTFECPEGMNNITSCVLCKEGLKHKINGISNAEHRLKCPAPSRRHGSRSVESSSHVRHNHGVP